MRFLKVNSWVIVPELYYLTVGLRSNPILTSYRGLVCFDSIWIMESTGCAFFFVSEFCNYFGFTSTSSSLWDWIDAKVPPPHVTTHQREPPTSRWLVWPRRHSASHCTTFRRWWRRWREDQCALRPGSCSCASCHSGHCQEEWERRKGIMDR